ncbi:hypothetical protein AVEN_184847-1 [Araneus ventricosus]|uniref:Uncharacterized protein n=1 Tax=Araneus ventricosus TaxID=182803 RepID=A0A4Y2LB08_ARAVE|nr:hypothetical protein AVEN_184847-1 [Araneus ventricosus]
MSLYLMTISDQTPAYGESLVFMAKYPFSALSHLDGFSEKMFTNFNRRLRRTETRKGTHTDLAYPAPQGDGVTHVSTVD